MRVSSWSLEAEEPTTLEQRRCASQQTQARDFRSGSKAAEQTKWPRVRSAPADSTDQRNTF
jgi:hypothetical protein